MFLFLSPFTLLDLNSIPLSVDNNHLTYSSDGHRITILLLHGDADGLSRAGRGWLHRVIWLVAMSRADSVNDCRMPRRATSSCPCHLSPRRWQFWWESLSCNAGQWPPLFHSPYLLQLRAIDNLTWYYSINMEYNDDNIRTIHEV